MSIGRPPEPVPADMADEIVAWIAEGKPLREFCRLPGKPAWRTVYDWLEKDEVFAARFARARDIGSDAIAEEGLEILDTIAEVVTGDGGSRRDSAHVAWLRNRFEGRLKLLSKWNPKKYGEKLEHIGEAAQTVILIADRFDGPSPVTVQPGLVKVTKP